MGCNTRIWVARSFLELFLQKSRSIPWTRRLATPTNLGLTSKRSLLFAGKLKSGFGRPYQNSCWDGRNYGGGTEGRSETQLIMAKATGACGIYYYSAPADVGSELYEARALCRLSCCKTWLARGL
jgi:hypothetical protein